MTKGRSWYERPVAAACLCAGALAVSVAALSGSAGGRERPPENRFFSVTQRRYGVEAREMERSVAVPLEDALSAVPGVREVSTASEHGVVRAFAVLDPAVSGGTEAVRAAALEVYEKLPRSAQRPEIRSEREGGSPVWTAAFTLSSVPESFLERELRSAFERIEGVGSVEISGAGIPELAVLLDDEKAAAFGLSAAAVAEQLAAADGLFSAGAVSAGGFERAATLDARFSGPEELRRALLRNGGGAAVPLGSLAAVAERMREPESVARVNGEKTVVVSVFATSGAALSPLSRALSDAVRRERRKLGASSFGFEPLSDRGAEEERSFRDALNASLQGAAAVALAVAATTSAAGTPLLVVSVLSVPFVLVAAAALLGAAGMPLDRSALAGLAAGIGAAVDAAVLTAERIGRAGPHGKGKAMRELAPSLAGGAATTLAALLPVAAMESFVPGSRVLAAAVGTAAVVSLAVAFVAIPPFAPGLGCRPRPAAPKSAVLRAVLRRTRRLLAANARLFARRPELPLAAACALGAAAVGVLPAVGVDVSEQIGGDAVPVEFSFEGGASSESVDSRLAQWGRAAAELEGVSRALTVARQGAGRALVAFDPRRTGRERVSAGIRGLPVAGGIAFLPEPAGRDRLWSVTVLGEDDRICRSKAEEAAAALSGQSFVKDLVLNFRDGPERLLLVPDRESLAFSGLPFHRVAETVRRALQAPPAYKRVDGGGETDVRVGSLQAAFFGEEELLRLPVAAGEGRRTLGEVAAARRETDAGRILRIDRRPAASLTIRTEAADPRRVQETVRTALKRIDLPPLYTIEFDREALEDARAISSSAILFAAALILSYLALAALTESFTAPLVALATVPPSLALPVLAAAFMRGAVDASAASAFVAVAGLAVNAAVLIVDERRAAGRGLPAAGSFDLYRLTRRRFASLCATSGTTVVGALPLLFLPEAGNSTVRSLAAASALGVGASFFVSLTVVPALAAAAPRLFDAWRSAPAAEKEKLP